MKIITYIFTLIFLLWNCQNKKPKLQLTDYIYEFKGIEPNKNYVGSSIIKNTGNNTLKILEIGTGCGCTQASISKNTIFPGDTCQLNFTYNTQNKQGFQEEFICIYANTDSLVHLLKIKAFINK